MTSQTNYTQAETLLLKAYEGFKKRDRERPSAARAKPIRETVERIIQLYEAWGKPEQAAEWKQKLPALEKANPR